MFSKTKIIKNISILFHLSIATTLFGAIPGMASEKEIKIKDKETKISSYRIGFEELHEMGLKGEKSSGITIIEPNMQFNLNHSAFKDKEITLLDVGRQPECPYGFKDLSIFRYDKNFNKHFSNMDYPYELSFWNLGYHAQGIASILIGQSNEKFNFDGGIAPSTKIELISFSHVNASGGHIKNALTPIDWTELRSF